MGNWYWDPDCGGDQVIDYGTDDRALLVTAFACAYPDGDGGASITVGDDLDPIVRIDVDEESQGRAMAACEEWLDRMVPLVREAIREKLEECSNGGSSEIRVRGEKYENQNSWGWMPSAEREFVEVC